MKAKLFGSVAALTLVGMASTAQAFDYTPWKWDFDNYTNMYNNEWIWANFYPSGMTVVESFQMFIGDVVATAVLQGDYLADPEVPNYNPCGHGRGHGHGGCGGPDVPELSLNDLGNMLQSVSAVGIASQIESNVPVYADLAQIVVGDYFQPATISASAWGGNPFQPLELAVDQSVSAVAALSSISLESAEPFVIGKDDKPCGGHHGHHGCGGNDVFTGYYPVDTNAILQADISQFAFADVTASAVAFQDLTQIPNLGNYEGLDVKGLVARQTVTAAGLVSSVSNIISAD